MGRQRSLICVLGLFAVVHLAGAQAIDGSEISAPSTPSDEFRLALEQARAGDLFDTDDSETVRRHPLYDYLLAQRIESRLERTVGDYESPDRDAAAFLDEHRGEPVAWQLRHTWLSSLARRERWEDFLAQYREEVADERLSCQYLTARISLDRLEGIAPLIIDRWLTPRQLPAQCEPVFQWLRDEGAMTDDHVEQRVLLLLDSGQASFAQIIARRLPEGRAAPLLRWAELIESPDNGLMQIVDGSRELADPRAVFDAWERLARDRPASALNLYASLMAKLPDEYRHDSAYTVALALGLAWDRRREALDLFAIAAPGDLDDYALEWRARAALWAGDWALAEACIAAMSASQRASGRWRYWTGRIAELQHDRGNARASYTAVIGDDNFYSGLAAARLRQRIQPTLEPLPRDARTVANLASRGAFARARALLGVGLPAAALREWRFGFAQLDDDGQRQTIHLAADWQWYDLAVATATRFGIFNDYDLLYPRPFGGEVLAATHSTELTADLVYAVIRQESLYRADAVSSAGARGLMQLRPGTAARFGRSQELPGTARIDLLDPAVNVQLGTAELERLLSRYAGSLPVALAAYNAGPNAAERWLPESPMEADIWIENIPFNETRGYVQRVQWHALVFRWLDTQRPQDTRGWLDRISPRPDRARPDN